MVITYLRYEARHLVAIERIRDISVDVNVARHSRWSLVNGSLCLLLRTLLWMTLFAACCEYSVQFINSLDERTVTNNLVLCDDGSFWFGRPKHHQKLFT